jgi:prepilin-type N-terminal cleavage/methylation domain-containing protein
MKRLRQYFRARASDDGGFTLIELAVSLGILSIVMTLAFSILISTMNISSVVSWQSTSNTELRQLIDSVFADVETARPALGCDADHNGRIDTSATSTEKVLKSSCDINSIVERSDGVLLVASPDRICYNTNRLLSRQATSANPPYAPVCLAVVNGLLRLETFSPPTPGDNNYDWNTTITSGALTRAVAGVRVLGRVDSKAANSNGGDGYFEYFKAGDSGSEKIPFTDTQPVTVGDVAVDALKDPERKAVNAVVLRARIAYGATGAQANRTRDIAYRVALRAARYSSERCATGNIDAGTDCS